MDLDVLDVLTELLTTADELAERIAETAGVDVLAPPTTAYDYPALGLYLAHVGEHLAAAAEIDHEALDDAQHTVRRMRARLEGALGKSSTDTGSL
ncbi:hypothetical protein CDO52_00025 [Nocardiopsis gilva YIM 90087]|uniref:Uncharacterized protein n=1 Tax=Nocardiopsis gilva YIM 90087 TaxID=1235441 RepID=A0A223RZT4_9ACTN|nr:hypothetical protein [Nocardiopsis gilva]ASU81381.1 hypothetical protein CDO52_00025 [Nocardiopsis gilva YIM 90087]